MSSVPPIRLRRFAGRSALEAALAERLRQALTQAEPGAACWPVMLSGGATPLPAYRALAQRRLRAAPQLLLLYSDERHVPPDSDASNYRQSRPLLRSLQLPEQRVLRVRTELPPAAAATDYAQRLAAALGANGTIALGLLGLGADGHTASLFSPEDLERAAGRLAVAVRRPDGRDAVSVTPALLARVRELLFVVAGADKRQALAQLLAGDPASIAARAVSGARAIEVWAEGAAAPQP